MRKSMLGALAAATMLWSVSAPAQELPIKTGDFWDVGSITIDDGHLFLLTSIDEVVPIIDAFLRDAPSGPDGDASKPS